MKAGRHTYIQKPLARTMGEVRVLAEYARTHPKLMTQMGNQGHAREGTRQIREWVEASAIGTVREVQFWTNRPIWPQAIDRPLEEYYVPATLDWNLWLGPAPERPYHPAYVPFKWGGFWDFGTGALGDMACHIMDAAYWALDLGLPARIEPESTPLFKETAPAGSRITYTFRAKGSRPEVRVVWHDGSLYPARPPEVADDAPWPFDRGGGQLWIGTDGKLVAGTYGDDPKVLDPAKQADIVARPPAQKYARSPGVYPEWIAACKGGTPAGSTFDGHAGGLTSMVLLGCLAVRLGRVLEINPEDGQGTSAGQPSRARTARLTLAYVTGLALFYAILGLFAGLSGSLFGTVSASPWARFAIGNLLLVFALAMFDVIPVSAPQRLMRWAAGLGGGSYPAVFLLGATSGVVAAPCGAPAFAAVLTWVATTRSGVLGFVYLFVFSLGMTALLVVVGLFSGSLTALPRAGSWMVWVKKLSGVVLLGMAEYYFIQMGQVL